MIAESGIALIGAGREACEILPQHVRRQHSEFPQSRCVTRLHPWPWMHKYTDTSVHRLSAASQSVAQVPSRAKIYNWAATSNRNREPLGAALSSVKPNGVAFKEEEHATPIKLAIHIRTFVGHDHDGWRKHNCSGSEYEKKVVGIPPLTKGKAVINLCLVRGRDFTASALVDGERSTHKSSSRGKGSSGSGATSHPGTHLGNAGPSRYSRYYSGNGGNNGEEDEDDDQDEDRSFEASTPSQSSEPRLACPFFQRMPDLCRERSVGNRKWRACGGPGWENTHRLKEHIYRTHLQPYHCTRCYRVFDDLAKLDQHCRKSPACERRERKEFAGIDKAQEKLLRSRRRPLGNRTLTETDKWYGIYRIIFPQDGTLPSPYYATNEMEDARSEGSYLSYLQGGGSSSPYSAPGGAETCQASVQRAMEPVRQHYGSEMALDALRNYARSLEEEICGYTDPYASSENHGTRSTVHYSQHGVPPPHVSLPPFSELVEPAFLQSQYQQDQHGEENAAYMLELARTPPHGSGHAHDNMDAGH